VVLSPAQTPIGRGCRGSETSRNRTPAPYQPSATTLLLLRLNQWLLQYSFCVSGPWLSALSGAFQLPTGRSRWAARSMRQVSNRPSFVHPGA